MMQKKKWITGIIGVLMLLAAAIFFLYRFYIAPFGTVHDPVEYIITPGTSLGKVAEHLENENIIRSRKVLLLWMRIKKSERKIQSGMVTLYHGDGVKNTSLKLLSAKPLEIRLMIPEGLTIEQTASHIMQTLPIDTSLFRALCYDSAFIHSCKLSVSSLEGYLFPDTYRLPQKVSGDALIRRMVSRHLETWSTLAIQPEIAKKYSPHEMVTLASIIEREATLFSEQPRISGVFHNRLKKGYPLGADPTVRFALKKFGGPLKVSELNSNSPYNTRKFKGLPPGPICSPGKGALFAAGNPLATNEMYFVAKWDGSGEHDFSVTNAEHDRKKNDIRNKNKLRLKRKAASDK